MAFFDGGFWNYVANLPTWQGMILIFGIVFIWAVGKYWKNVISWIGKKLSSDGEVSETLQYRMFWGLTNDAINIVMKDEIRRSFKENGFENLSGNDFSKYVKNQSETLLSAIKNHIINLYPPDHRKLKVSMEETVDYVKNTSSKIEDIIFEMYIEAKNIKKHDIEELEKIDAKFGKEIDSFSKKEHEDCSSCFVILFGKREIAENKKSKIKTLKTQMNFVEQKLSQIHSMLLSFYTKKLNEN